MLREQRREDVLEVELELRRGHVEAGRDAAPQLRLVHLEALHEARAVVGLCEEALCEAHSATARPADRGAAQTRPGAGVCTAEIRRGRRRMGF